MIQKINFSALRKKRISFSALRKMQKNPAYAEGLLLTLSIKSGEAQKKPEVSFNG
jgi:hypothetical protein